MPPSDRPKYTKDQVEQYFDYIGLPSAAREELKQDDCSSQLRFLTTLLRYQLSQIPFENLDLHYAPVKGISLNLTHLFDKVVERKAGRGGYCMQNNAFFGTILRSLGYDVMSVGARVAHGFSDKDAGRLSPDESTFGGFSHQVNIINIDGKKYFTDCGFGSQCPTSPVPLIDGFTGSHTSTKDKVFSSMRLTRGFPGNNTSRNAEQEVWMYSVKYSDASDDSKLWIPIYCFAEIEFFPIDFEMLSAWVSTSHPTFVGSVMCQIFLRSDDNESLVGNATVKDNVIKVRRNGSDGLTVECENEDERVRALEEYLGIKLSISEREGIKGHRTAIQ